MIYLVLFQIKHFIADWCLQSMWMVKGKRRSDWTFVFPLLAHAGLHSVFTFFVVNAVSRDFTLSLKCGLFDLTAHFIIDRIKGHPYLDFLFDWSNPNKKIYWVIMGLDQLCHSLTYLVIWYYFLVK